VRDLSSPFVGMMRRRTPLFSTKRRMIRSASCLSVGSPPESQRSVICGIVCETRSICSKVMSPGRFNSSW
jgi:hypothetical protein